MQARNCLGVTEARPEVQPKAIVSPHTSRDSSPQKEWQRKRSADEDGRIPLPPLVVNDEVSWRQRETSFGITGRRGSGTVMVAPPEISSLQCALHEGSSCFDPLPLSPPWWDLVRHAAAKIVGREAFALASLCGHTMRAPPRNFSLTLRHCHVLHE